MLDKLFNNPIQELNSLSSLARKIDDKNRELKFKIENPSYKWEEYNEAFKETNKLTASEQLSREAMEEDNR
jgi:hypothetical protein